MPKVSVLVPYYNDERFLRAAIDSVLAQTFADFELVLVNHASTDSSRAIARACDDPRLVHVDMPVNHGAGGGLVVEAFMAVARGEYVKFFCADDTMEPTGLERLVAHLDAHPEQGMAFGNLTYVDADGRPLGADWFSSRPRFSRDLDSAGALRELAAGYSVLPWSGSLVRRALVAGLRLDATLVMQFDMSVWASLLLRGVKLGLVDAVVARYRVHSGQVSSVERRAEAEMISCYENTAYRRLFLACRDVPLMRAVFPDDKFVAAATPEDLPLALALHYLVCDRYAFAAYLMLHDAMDDPDGRRRLETRFGVTVAEFRRMLRRGVGGPRRRSRWVRFRDWLFRRPAKRGGTDFSL